MSIYTGKDDLYWSQGTAEYVKELFPKEFKGICVEVGAFAPKVLSNSWIFEQDGWEVYCIEPNPKCIPELKKYRKHVLEYACGAENLDDQDLFVYNVSIGEAAITGLLDLHAGKLYTRVEKVTVRTLDWLMENEIKKDHIDYLSIDVERNEMNVLRGTDLARWNPAVIAIENLDDARNSNFLGQRVWLETYGYVYHHRIEANDIFTKETL